MTTFSCGVYHMNSFKPGFIESQPISQALLQTIRTIGEYKGQERLYEQQSPQVLEALRRAAIIESTESSNRLEGVSAPHDRVIQLVENRVTPGRAASGRHHHGEIRACTGFSHG
jgi:hypothetical protein